MYKRVVKRILDILISIIALILASPIMLIVAIAVICDSDGSVIFKDQRMGKDGKTFTCYKFRSMSESAPKNCASKLLDSDLYLTKVGKFIRKTSLDELPQFLCVLKGDMSVIGPRPTILSELDLISAREALGVNNYKPGITGLAQVSGRDFLAANANEKAKYDAKYCDNITFLGDCKIFVKTVLQVLCRKGVVEGVAVNGMASDTTYINLVNNQSNNSTGVSTNAEVKTAAAMEYDLQEVAADALIAGSADIKLNRADAVNLINKEKSIAGVTYREEVISELKENLQEVQVKKANDNIA